MFFRVGNTTHAVHRADERRVAVSELCDECRTAASGSDLQKEHRTGMNQQLDGGLLRVDKKRWTVVAHAEPEQLDWVAVIASANFKPRLPVWRNLWPSRDGKHSDFRGTNLPH